MWSGLLLLIVWSVASSSIDGCAESTEGMGEEYCVLCQRPDKRPTPDGKACAPYCGNDEGIKDCTACSGKKCSACADTVTGESQYPTLDGLTCFTECKSNSKKAIEFCVTCTSNFLGITKCTSCQAPYTPAADGKSCILKCDGATIDGCQECNTDASTCKTCQLGYALSATQPGRCFRTCGGNSAIEYCTGCNLQRCTECTSVAYISNGVCRVRKELGDLCSSTEPCHIGLQCLFEGPGVNKGQRKCFPTACKPSIKGVMSVCNGQGSCTDMTFSLKDQTSSGTCKCLSTDLNDAENCAACKDKALTPDFANPGTCIAPTQGPYASCSATLACQAGLTCFSNYNCVPSACASSELFGKWSICNGAGRCSEPTLDSATNKWSASCTCFYPHRTPESRCRNCEAGYSPVGIKCAKEICVEKSILCSNYGTCKDDGSACECQEGFAPVTVNSKHRCYPSTCGGDPANPGSYCRNGLGTCVQQLDLSYLCACPAGYRGVTTRTGMEVNTTWGGCAPWSCYPMLNGSICGPYSGGRCEQSATAASGYECNCSEGYSLTSKGCLPDTCGPTIDGTLCRAKGYCEQQGGGWNCTCLDGYDWTTKGCFNRRCRASKEGIPCNNHGECLNNTRCKCNTGYTGVACALTTVALAMIVVVPILVAVTVGVLVYIFVKRAVTEKKQNALLKTLFPAASGST